MNKAGEFLTRHRNLFLLTLLLTTLCISSASNQARLEASNETTALPVMRTSSQTTSAVSAYISERDAAHQRDVAALTALCAQEELDSQTRQDAADRLTQLIANREAQQALEDALSLSSLAPCAAVVSGGSVTIVTHKRDVTEQDAALVLTLATAHAGAEAADVRIVPAE